MTYNWRNQHTTGAALLRVHGGGVGFHPELLHQIPPRAQHGNRRRMSFKLSNHARQELARRDIALAEVEAVLAAPGQIVPEHGGIVCYQSQTTCDRKPCLLRVMVNEAGESKVVVTIYRTSKISKYWQI